MKKATKRFDKFFTPPSLVKGGSPKVPQKKPKAQNLSSQPRPWATSYSCFQSGCLSSKFTSAPLQTLNEKMLWMSNFSYYFGQSQKSRRCPYKRKCEMAPIVHFLSLPFVKPKRTLFSGLTSEPLQTSTGFCSYLQSRSPFAYSSKTLNAVKIQKQKTQPDLKPGPCGE